MFLERCLRPDTVLFVRLFIVEGIEFFLGVDVTYTVHLCLKETINVQTNKNNHDLVSRELKKESKLRLNKEKFDSRNRKRQKSL